MEDRCKRDSDKVVEFRLKSTGEKKKKEGEDKSRKKERNRK